jgi:hypothetical protein
MTEPHSEPDQRDLDARLDEQRASGQYHRPLQTPATESSEASLEAERRAVDESQT